MISEQTVPRSADKGQGRIQMGFVGFSRAPFVSKFHLHGLRYRLYPKYSHPLTLYLKLFFSKSILLPLNVCEIAG